MSIELTEAEKDAAWSGYLQGGMSTQEAVEDAVTAVLPLYRERIESEIRRAGGYDALTVAASAVREYGDQPVDLVTRIRDEQYAPKDT